MTESRRKDDIRATEPLDWQDTGSQVHPNMALPSIQTVLPVCAAKQPKGDNDQWIFDLAAEHEAHGSGLYGPVMFNATGLVEFVHAAIAAHLARQDQAGAVAADAVLATWPERIYLQWNPEEREEYPGPSEDLTWCAENVHKSDVEYVRADLAAPTQGSAPQDPMDWPLPCDVKVGAGTIRKGCPLRTLVLRMESLHRMASAAFPHDPAQAAEFWKRVEEIRGAGAQEDVQGGDLTTVDCPTCTGKGMVGGHVGQTPESYDEIAIACDECSGQGKVIVSRADMAALAVDSEGGHHD